MEQSVTTDLSSSGVKSAPKRHGRRDAPQPAAPHAAEAGVTATATMMPQPLPEPAKQIQFRSVNEAPSIAPAPAPVPAPVFDECMYEIASAHLKATCPLTPSSINYVTVVNDITTAHADLDWVYVAERAISAEQFALETIVKYRNAMALPVNDPRRPRLLQEIEKTNRTWNNSRTRLATRTRRLKTKIARLTDAKRVLELEQILAWEAMKAQ